MSKMPTLKQTALATLVALGSMSAALPARADTIDWASWSNVVVGNTTGAATATFAAVGVTASYTGEIQQLVPNYPSYGPAGTFNGGTIGNAPASTDGILRIIGGTATATNTITFSQAVLNPVIAIWSLGQGGIQAQFAFNQAFTIQAGGPTNEYAGSSITSIGNVVYGNEGNGVVQFTGSFTSISWTNPVAENWYGFTAGVPVTAVPEPGTYALMLAGLGALAFVARRRKNA